MTQSYQFLVARADEAAMEAQKASLNNVKQRALRSEAAWRGMADRALKMEREREKTKVRKDLREAAIVCDSSVSSDIP